MQTAIETDAAIDDPLDAMLGHQLRRTSVAVMAALTEVLEPVKLSPGEASLLMLIGANPGSTQSGISRSLRAQPANLVPLISRLEAIGALQRIPGKGRAIALTLSPVGETLHLAVEAAFARHEARLARGLRPEEQEQAIALLRRVCANACCKDSD